MTRPVLKETILTNLSGMLPDGRAWLISMGDLWVAGHRVGIRARVSDLGFLIELAPPCIPSSSWAEALSAAVAAVAEKAADPRYRARAQVAPRHDREGAITDFRGAA